MPNKTKCSPSRKADYDRRSNGVTSKNKEKKLEKHLSNHPNDIQSSKHTIPDYRKSK